MQLARGAPMTARILRWATGCVAAVSVALLVAGIALSYVDRHMGSLSRWDFSDVFEEATFIAVPVVSFILTSRRPGNRVGWIFLGTGLALGLGFFCDRYGRGGLVAAPGSLPAARAAAWFANSALTTIPAAGLTFILLLFPAGRLRSRRWRPAAWFVAAAFTLYTAAEVVRACHVWADPFTALSSGWYPGSHTAVLILVPAALLVGGTAVVVRFAGSSGAERLQLKWFVTAAVLVVAAIIPLSLAPQIGLSPAAASAAVSALKVVFCLTLVCLFTAIAVAVLKYRLYDIDRVISRTLAYAIVTGVLAGVYAGLVLLATQVFDLHTPVAVAAATLAAAALFAPVRDVSRRASSPVRLAGFKGSTLLTTRQPGPGNHQDLCPWRPFRRKPLDASWHRTRAIRITALSHRFARLGGPPIWAAG